MDIKVIVKKIESSPMPLIFLIFTFLAGITLRNFLELVIAHGFDPQLVIEALPHTSFFYISLCFSLFILFHLATGEKLGHLARFILPSFLIIITVPLIDYLISQWKGYQISYLLPGIHKDMMIRFFMFFGPLDEFGVSMGIRIEIALAVLASFIYFSVKSRDLFKSIFFSFLVYALIFGFFSVPFILEGFLGLFNLEYDFSSGLMADAFFLMTFFQLIWLSYLADKHHLGSVLKIILHSFPWFLLTASSILLTFPVEKLIYLTPSTLFDLFFLAISAFTASSSVILMRFYKKGKILEEETSLENISPDTCNKIILSFSGLALFYAVNVNFLTFFAVLFLLSVFFLYYLSPLRKYIGEDYHFQKKSKKEDGPEILLIDKPKNITSFDVIRYLRKKYKIRKMGHAGTLDPLATGLLIVGMGKGTKKLKDFLKQPKVYEALILLGKKTTTGDMEGRILEEKEIKVIDERKVEETVASLQGKIVLPVPVYSAIKVSGTPMYKIARKKGYHNIKPPKKKMEVVWIKCQKIQKQEKNYIIYLTCKVSSGTYIRSLAEEIGNRLGVPAVLKELRRIQIGDIMVEKAERISCR